MAAPTSTAELLELVHQNLPLDPLRLDTYVARLRNAAALPGKPGDLAALLVRDEFLTPFQAEHLMRGRRPKFVIGKYLILDRIGAGGMGAVYLCEDLQMERQVALKVLPTDQADDPASLARFIREAQAVAALNHPNIVRANDMVVDSRPYFLVMEYVDGVNLQDLVARGGWLDVTRAAHYISQAAEGLQHAFTLGLVHRDIKPANLLLSRAGVVKVLDMGLARFFRDDADGLTKENSAQSILGTADYLAPEQARDSHDVDVRADIYSLGATLYFLLVGRPPFADGTINQKLLWHQMKAPPPVRKLRPEVPEEMAAVVARMMAKDPAARCQTPAEVVAALAPWTRTPLPPPAPAEMPPVRPTARAGRPWRKSTGPTGSTVVSRVARGTVLAAPPTAQALPPIAAKVTLPNLEIPSASQPPAAAAPPAATAPPVAAPPTAASRPPPRVEEDWSRLFDDDGGGAPSSPSAGRRSRPRLDPRFRKSWWQYAGVLPALLLLVGGVWFIFALISGGSKPEAPASSTAAPAPVAPRGPVNLRATAAMPSGIELKWEDPNGPSTGFHVARATDLSFTQNVVGANVAGGNVHTYTDSRATAGATYFYRVRALRESGESAPSNAAFLEPDYAQGFTPAGLALNGGAAVVNKALRVTDANNNEARSAFYQTQVDVRSFRTQFRFRITSPGSDGFTFCIQANEPTRVGEGAGGLGYQGIPNSLAVKFDLWDNEGEGSNSTGLYRDGDKPTKAGAIDLGGSHIDLHNGRAYDVDLDYKDYKMTLSITDTENAANKFFTQTHLNVPKTVGGPTAYVGFTGGTGGGSAVQDILTWTWQSTQPAD